MLKSQENSIITQSEEERNKIIFIFRVEFGPFEF